MKLSYRDRVILIVVLIIAIIALVAIGLIRPTIKDINTDKSTLETTKQTWTETEAKLNQIEPTKKRITEKRDNAAKLAEYFTPETLFSEQDQFLHKALDDNDMYVIDLTMTDPEAAPLEFYYENPHELSYNLNQHADLDGSMAKALAGELREYLVLSERTAQDVATRTSTIQCRAKKEDLMNFLADIKKMDTTVLVESVTIDDYTFCPAEDAEESWTPQERAEKVDHSTMTIVIKFYSVPVPTAVDLGE